MLLGRRRNVKGKKQRTEGLIRSLLLLRSLCLYFHSDRRTKKINAFNTLWWKTRNKESLEMIVVFEMFSKSQ